jgi:hypothetical protein
MVLPTKGASARVRLPTMRLSREIGFEDRCVVQPRQKMGRNFRLSLCVPLDIGLFSNNYEG